MRRDEMAALFRLAADLGARGGIVRKIAAEYVELLSIVDSPDTTWCAECGAAIEQPATGRRRQTCGDACRKARSRRRAVSRNVTEPIALPRVPVSDADVR